MSPAKRLSRQRFRALCERCKTWSDELPTPHDARMLRHFMAMVRLHKRSDATRPWAATLDTVEALARLAR